MKSHLNNLPELAYPVLKWEPGDILIAKTPAKLCGRHASGFPEHLQHAKRGRTHLFDAAGGHFKVVDYIEVKPFGRFFDLLLPSIFNENMYVPVLANERRLPLAEFKKRVACAVQDRYVDDYAEEKVAEASLKTIREAKSYREVLAAIPYFSRF